MEFIQTQASWKWENVVTANVYNPQGRALSTLSVCARPWLADSAVCQGGLQTVGWLK